MAVVVFDCPLDQETLLTIQELRQLRIEVLERQLADIDKVLMHLMAKGALQESEKESYRDVIWSDLNQTCQDLKGRVLLPDTVYCDEIELYLEILHSKSS